jgi:hypothetical protein
MDQTLSPQRDQIVQVGVEPERIYQDLASGRHDSTPAATSRCGSSQWFSPFLLDASVPTWDGMFAVDEATAEAIRRAFDESGELAGVVEFRRHFPLISDNAKAGECVRIIAGWKPVSARAPRPVKAPRTRRPG